MEHQQSKQIDKLLHDLKERAKELNCLYQIEEFLNDVNLTLEEIFKKIISIIPAGWQFPGIYQARIFFEDTVYQSPNYKNSSITQCADIKSGNKKVGVIEVSYIKEVPLCDRDYFLKEEQRLITTIADRIGQTILHRELKQLSYGWEKARKEIDEQGTKEWKVVIDLIKRTNQSLYIHISTKMIYYLFWNGVREAEKLLHEFSQARQKKENGISEDFNKPSQKQSLDTILLLSEETFNIASNYLNDAEILTCIQKWIQEEKASFLIKALDTLNTPLADIIDAITKYHYIAGEINELSASTEKGLRVSLIRRFFSDQLEFINIAKQFIELRDFYELVKKIVFPTGSFGRLGGKSAGLFLAQQILTKSKEFTGKFNNLKIPKTWYITADAILQFVHYNNLEEVTEQKYKEIEQIRLEYPNIVQLLKNAYFPPEIIKGLAMALDDFGDSPLIVRSSSLLEDRIGTAFSGKYKSLFLANQGSKQQRLDALMDAIAEVYASVFGPDPIEYRAERNLLDFNEEMGIMIQEVVGTKVGHYFFPSFAGVVFSNNEFRWSSRIKREDGLIRMVPGLGTRAVDRLSDDYPVLLSPGQPGLRINITADEVKRYSPKKIDVINLTTNSFETIEISALLKEFGEKYPGIHHIASVNKDNYIYTPSALNMDFQKDDFIVTFESLINRTAFIDQVRLMLSLLRENMGTPVDVEFASDGKYFYLLQCRSQSSAKGNVASPIPKDIKEDLIIFSASRYISNGRIPDITHIVYVDPVKYNELSDLNQMVEIGHAVSKLNSLLPKRKFILMGPGRWGSRGDIKLGVPVTYSDFNNTAALIEIARKKGNYIPELSFGTHFFQDLVESSIRYLPLYPDDPGIIFNNRFLLDSKNILPDVLPEYTDLSDTLHVLDVPHLTGGLVLRVLMNADLGEAIGYLASPSTTQNIPVDKTYVAESSSEEFWRWRFRMAELIASRLDEKRFGVKGMYLFGSTKNATAGPQSDIDLLVHFNGTESQKKEFMHWMEGWSLCLAEMNFLRTGYKSDGLLDIHIVTDQDVVNKTGHAVKIGAVTNAARPLFVAKDARS